MAEIKKIRTADDVRDILVYNDCVGFGFFKEEDGSFRIARGTLAPDIIDAVYFFVGDCEYDENRQVRFWDLDKEEWRSFIFTNLIRTSVKILDGTEGGWTEIINRCKEEHSDFEEKLIIEPEQRRFVWKKK